MDVFEFDFMRRALMASVLVGVAAPLIGVFLVQRRLALLGDGMGHVALTGVGLAFLTGVAPIPMALLVACLGAVVLEIIRNRSRVVGDVALALIFYGGIAGGVFLTSLSSDRSSAALNQYLFGSLSTVSEVDVYALTAAVFGIMIVLLVFGRQLFALSLNVDLARTQGLAVVRLSMLLSVLAAVAVVVGMRTVGLLLVSAIMIVPIAAAQQLTRSFAATAVVGVIVGVVSAVVGLIASYYIDVPPGPTIVFLTLGIFVCAAIAGRFRQSINTC